MTLKQIAEQIKVPESTVRLYRDEFAEFVPATGEGRRRRYEAVAAQILTKIVEWKKAGASSATIRQELARTQTPQEKRRAITQEEQTMQVLVSLEAQKGELALLRVEVGALRNEIGRLVALLSADRQAGKTMEAIQREQLPLLR